MIYLFKHTKSFYYNWYCKSYFYNRKSTKRGGAILQIQKKYFGFYICNLFLPLIIGTTIYLLFRPDTYISVVFYKLTNWTPISWNPDNLFFREFLLFLKNYSCDLLWAYALSIALWIFHTHRLLSLALIFIECIIFEMLIEFLQYKTLISGTFDIWDIILESVSSIVAIIVILISFRDVVTSNL